MYGDAEIVFSGGKLSARFGPNYSGTLEHWNYDTFQVIWRDPVMGKSLISFNLNTRGKVETVDLGTMGKFTKVPDKTSDAGN